MGGRKRFGGYPDDVRETAGEAADNVTDIFSDDEREADDTPGGLLPGGLPGTSGHDAEAEARLKFFREMSGGEDSVGGGDRGSTFTLTQPLPLRISAGKALPAGLTVRTPLLLTESLPVRQSCCRRGRRTDISPGRRTRRSLGFSVRSGLLWVSLVTTTIPEIRAISAIRTAAAGCLWGYLRRSGVSGRPGS